MDYDGEAERKDYRGKIRLGEKIGPSYTSTHINLHIASTTFDHLPFSLSIYLFLLHSNTQGIFIECLLYANTVPDSGGVRMSKRSLYHIGYKHEFYNQIDLLKA